VPHGADISPRPKVRLALRIPSTNLRRSTSLQPAVNRELFANLKEAQVLTGHYREHYNRHRTHGALSYLSPAEFAAREAERLIFVQRLSS
jgi:transposase InsO family protein